MGMFEHLGEYAGLPVTVFREYGDNATVADLAPLFGGERFSAIRHLGLEAGAIQNEIAGAIASAPIVARLEPLSLAMGTLTDQGRRSTSVRSAAHPPAPARPTPPRPVRRDDGAKVKAALPGVNVDLRQEDPDNGVWTYFAMPE